MRFVVSAAVAALAFSAVPAQAAEFFRNFGVTSSTIAGLEAGDTLQLRAIIPNVTRGSGSNSSTFESGEGQIQIFSDSFSLVFDGFYTQMVSNNGNYETTFTTRLFGGDGIIVRGDFSGVTSANLRAGSAFAVLSPSAAVPEPATWAMMIAGFGLVGLTRRRAQTASTNATAS